MVTELQLGPRIRSLRQARRLTLRDVPVVVLFCMTPPSF